MFAFLDELHNIYISDTLSPRLQITTQQLLFVKGAVYFKFMNYNK